MYTVHIPIWRPSWISHFTPAIHYITLQNFYFGYHLICISAPSTHELLLSAAIIFWQIFKICI